MSDKMTKLFPMAYVAAHMHDDRKRFGFGSIRNGNCLECIRMTQCRLLNSYPLFFCFSVENHSIPFADGSNWDSKWTILHDARWMGLGIQIYNDPPPMDLVENAQFGYFYWCSAVKYVGRHACKTYSMTICQRPDRRKWGTGKLCTHALWKMTRSHSTARDSISNMCWCNKAITKTKG